MEPLADPDHLPATRLDAAPTGGAPPHDLIAGLADRVAPGALATERLLPVSAALRELVPDGGLVRGRVLASSGSAAATMALALVSDALAAGGWMAVVDVPTFGADAADELGIPLERVVRVDARADDESMHVQRWLDVLAAAVEGFDVVVASVPAGVRRGHRSAAVRSLVARVQQRGAVVVVLGAAGGFPVDVTYTSQGRWSGLGRGHGIARCRQLRVAAAGRRQPRRLTASIDVDVVDRRVTLSTVTSVDRLGGDRTAPDDDRPLRLAAG